MTMFWQATGKHARPRRRWWRRWTRRTLTGDEGTTTVEYALGTVAAAALAGVLYSVVTGDSVFGALTGLINHALSPAG